MISFEGVNLLWHWDNYDLTCNQVLGSGAASTFCASTELESSISMCLMAKPRIFPRQSRRCIRLLPSPAIPEQQTSLLWKVYDEVFKNGGSTGNVVTEARIRHTWNISKPIPMRVLASICFSAGRAPAPTAKCRNLPSSISRMVNGSNRPAEVYPAVLPVSLTKIIQVASLLSPLQIKVFLPCSLQWGIFTANKEKSTSSLKWTTTSEMGTKDFLVQHLGRSVHLEYHWHCSCCR